MSYLYTDNADVLLWRGSEVAACPTRFTNRTDDQRQQDLYSRKSTELVYRRGSVAWRLALFETFTAYSFVSPGRPRSTVSSTTPVAWRFDRRVPLATFTARADGRGEYRTTKEIEDLVRLRSSFARPPVMRRAGQSPSAGAPRRNQLETTGHFFSRMKME